MRSIQDLSEFQELFQLAGIDWVDLQKGVFLGGFDQIRLPKNSSVVHLGEKLVDFMQTGAICMQLDLLICVDTSIAHLAGALNIPTWLMLPTYTDWRWGLDPSKSSWYPSIKIFRQDQIGRWANVVQSMRNDLREKLLEISLSDLDLTCE